MDKYFERCTKGPPFEGNEQMKYEFCRLLSFNNWPSESTAFPIKLAKAGFYFTGNRDEVKCCQCGAVKLEWHAGDDPYEIHRQLNPDCLFLMEGNEQVNIPFSQKVDNQEESSLIQRLDSVIEQREKVDEEYSNDTTEEGASGESCTSNRSGMENVPEDFQQPEFVLSFDERSTDSSESTVLRSHSLGNLQELSRQGLQSVALSESRSSTFPNAHFSGDTNVADSAVIFNRSTSGSTSGAVRNACLNPTNTKSKDDKKKDKSSKKSKDKKDKKSSKTAKSTSSGRSGNETKTASQRGQDIPPPMGESIGPLRFERNRLQTFQNWPSNACVPATELAKCGFCYTGSGDRVQCIFCKGVLRNWEEGDRPHIEHRKHFPRCPLVLGLKIGNVPLPLDQNPTTASAQGMRRSNSNVTENVAYSLSNMENLGIITDRPKHPLYAIESQRLASFQSWPPYKHQTPQQLAEAGFWYAGFNDNVKCFYCDGGLRNWEPEDEPWKEHARWFPKCPYVIQVKSQEFINNVLKEKGVEIPAYTRGLEPSTSAATGDQSRAKFRVEEREIRARMDSPHIQKVLDLGISRTVVMNTLRKRLRETGDDFPSITSLMEAIFKEEAAEAKRQSKNAPQSQNAPRNQNASVSQNASEGQATADEIQTNDGEAGNPDVELPVEHEGDKKQESDIVKTDQEIVNKNKTAEDKESSPAIHVQADDLMKENLELKEQRLCKICMVSDANVVFLPCGHLVSCATCSPALQQCPICRASIKGTIRTYIA